MNATIRAADIGYLNAAQTSLSAMMGKVDILAQRCNNLFGDPEHRDDSETIVALSAACCHLSTAYAALREAEVACHEAECRMATRGDEEVSHGC